MSTNTELRELDALIAQRLFGWVWLRHDVRIQQTPKPADKWRTEWRRSLFIPTHELKPFDTGNGIAFVAADGSEPIDMMNAPHYSSSWEAAAEVIDSMERYSCDFCLEKAGANNWFAYFGGVSASAESAPEAICRAALKVVEATHE